MIETAEPEEPAIIEGLELQKKPTPPSEMQDREKRCYQQVEQLMEN